jgi:hypothetical protein
MRGCCNARPRTPCRLPETVLRLVLHIAWAEFYRQTKIEETVYELLTQQYELN